MPENKRGITLIALVITIIVLLILAGISISMFVGDNGILNNATNSKTNTEISVEKEILKVAVIYAQTTESGKLIEISEENLRKELDKEIKDGYDTEVDDGIIVTFKESGRSYKVDIDGEIKEYIYKLPVEQPENGGIYFNMTIGTTDIVFLTGTSYEIGNANSPEVDDTMIPIKYNGENWVVTTTSDPEWYNYDTVEKKWANVMLSDGTYTSKTVTEGQVLQESELGSMLVWIPRYAYKILYFDTEDDKDAYLLNRNDTSKVVGYSDARGIVDTQGKTPTQITKSQVTSIAVGDNYRPHPVFEKNVEQGGWGKKTKGIWVGKFETSTTLSSYSTNMILPNKSAQRVVNITDAFNKCKKLSETLDIELDTHLMKASEWGAIAYLTESQYGRNGEEVSVNQCLDFYTGVGRGLNNSEDETFSGESEYYNSTYKWSAITDIQKYDGSVGLLSSSTGNIYGIYDLVGGSWEYVMGFYQDASGNIHTGYLSTSHSNYNGFLSDGTEYTDGEDLPDRKYYQLYTSYIYNSFGDAIIETKGWNSDRFYSVSGTYPVATRSGMNKDTSVAGIFYCDNYRGSGHGNESYRVCFTVK